MGNHKIRKLKLPHYAPWGRLGERKYSVYSFLTSALDEGGWSASRPGRALPPGKGPPVPIGQESGWSPEPVWTQRLEEKSFDSAGDLTPIAQSSSAYADTILTELPQLLKHKIRQYNLSRLAFEPGSVRDSVKNACANFLSLNGNCLANTRQYEHCEALSNFEQKGTNEHAADDLIF
jgi:hypothetical protein